MSLTDRCSHSATADKRSAADSGARKAINLFFNIDLGLSNNMVQALLVDMNEEFLFVY